MENENDGKEVVQKAVLTSPVELVRSVFSSVSRQGGRVTGFSWNKKLCAFDVTGCSSEVVVENQGCIVSFLGGKPHFSIVLPFEKFYESKKSFDETDFDRGTELSLRVERKSLQSVLRFLGAFSRFFDEVGLSEEMFSVLPSGSSYEVKMRVKRSRVIEKRTFDLLCGVIFENGRLPEKMLFSKNGHVSDIAARYAHLFGNEMQRDFA